MDKDFEPIKRYASVRPALCMLPLTARQQAEYAPDGNHQDTKAYRVRCESCSQRDKRPELEVTNVWQFKARDPSLGRSLDESSDVLLETRCFEKECDHNLLKHLEPLTSEVALSAMPLIRAR